ncbi:TorD/DmsD family molecular chaperone [Novispirillum sp. DQ9]|uniref:TorD/DmsD family molecular chaperone n=1 Tax=Novispirillum sp. DQ9 TaxID=3398612 RepID=UPI003C7D7D84
MTAHSAPSGVEDAELLRAQVYALLARLLMSPPDGRLLARLAALGGDQTALGQAIGALSAAAATTDETAAEREFGALFIGVTRGEVVPYASYYRTGFLNDRPLAVLREDMARLGLAAAQGVAEPEDHLGALCDMMAALITRGTELPIQKAFFDRHLQPWAGRAFDDIAAAPSAVLYAPVGAIGRVLLSIDEDAFALEGD